MGRASGKDVRGIFLQSVTRLDLFFLQYLRRYFRMGLLKERVWANFLTSLTSLGTFLQSCLDWVGDSHAQRARKGGWELFYNLVSIGFVITASVTEIGRPP